MAVNIVAWRAIVAEMRGTIAVADPLAAANLAQAGARIGRSKGRGNDGRT